MAYYPQNDDSLEDSDSVMSSDSEPVAGDVDGYTGDDSNSVRESVDVNSESEPDQLGDDEPPSEETPPQKIRSDCVPKRRRVGVSPVHSNRGTKLPTARKPPVPGGSRLVSAGVTPSRTPSREQTVNPKVAFNSSRKTPAQGVHVPARSDPKGCDGGGSLSTVLGDITNMLGAVIERLDKTESKLESMERKLNSPSSSSAASGADTKRKIPIIVRTETRKVYKTLLDGDEFEFTGFDLSSETTYKDTVNQDVSRILVKEVCGHNPNFSASDVRAAAYTYYTSLCQDQAHKRKGVYAQRKTQRRRRERVVRRRSEREAQFMKMSFSDADRAKWKKVLVTEFMSSDESGEEDGHPVFIVKTLTWRSERVSNFFERLDAARSSRKTEQANRQTKARISKNLVSTRPAPHGFPSWALVT